MICRRMTKDDIDGVYKIEKISFADPWSKESIRTELKNPLSNYIVCERDGVIVGYLGVWFIIDEAHITNVAVDPSHRKAGIGSSLIEKLVEDCKKSNIKSITLEVRKSNIIAQNLYRKYGFKPGGIRKEYYNDNKEDAIIMWKQVEEV